MPTIRQAAWLIAVSLLLAAFAVSAWGQASTGSISGVVTDPTGATIPGATVSIRNLDNGLSHTVTTADDGRFAFNSIPGGPYELSVSKPGFARHLRGPVHLLLNQNAVLNASLKPTGTAEEVTVTDDAPLINTTNAEVGVRFDSHRLSEIPQAGQGAAGGGFRDIFSYALSAPGVSQMNSGNAGFSAGTAFSVNGMRTRSNNFMVDGQDVNDPSVTGYQQQWNNPDAVEEFRLLTSQFSAEYGRAGGSVVNVVTKSGTNRLHGSAFWFHNDNTLNTRSNLEKAAQVGTGIDKQPLRIENQFGGTIGGPIKKNKTFFFGSLQRWTDRQLGAGSTINGAPTDVGRTALQNNDGSLPQVQALLKFLPQAQTAAKNLVFYCHGAPAGSGPVISGKGLAQTATCPAGTLVTVPVGDLTNSTRQAFNDWQWSTRVDHQINPRNSFNARYMFNTQLNSGSGQATPAGLSNVSPARSQAATAALTSTLTPHLLNEARFSWNKFRSATGPEDLTSLQIPSIEIANMGLTGFNASATRTAIGYGVNLPQSRVDNTYQIQDSMTWTHGSHTFKFGADIRQVQVRSDFNPNVRGQLRYTDLHRFVADVADQTAQINAPLPGGQLIMYYFYWDEYLYAQDTWKIRPSFTLNYGVRYELPGDSISSLYNVNDRIVAANGNNPIFRYNSRPERDTNNFAPRVGFAWNPRFTDGFLSRLTGGDKLVLRGGYAVSYDYAFLNMALNISSAFPFQAAFSIPGTSGVWNAIHSQTLNVAKALFLNQTRVAPEFRAPYAQQYSLEAQRELGANTVFRLGYIGTKGTALFQSKEGNPTTRCFPVPSTGCPRVDPTQGVIRVRTNTGASIYHSMQVSLERRPVAGFSGGLHYTWSSFIDDGSDVFNPSGNAEVAEYQDPFSNAGERARSTYDRPQRISGNVVYELPWMRNQPGAIGRVLGGWQISAIITFQSGSPFTVLNGTDPAKVLLGSLVGTAIRPNIADPNAVRGKSITELLAAGGASLWTALPSNGSIPTGNSARNTIRGDSLQSVDFSIMKGFKIAEGHEFQFRADMFNLPNTRNFGIPESRINTGTAFLNEKATDGGKRRVFLSLRYTF